MRLIAIISVLISILALGSCSSVAGSQDCTIGTERCPCTTDNACDPGLSCLSGRCMRDGEGGGGTSGSSNGAAASSGAEGAAPGDGGLACPASVRDALLDERRSTSTATEPLSDLCRSRAASGTGTAITIHALTGDPTGEASAVVRFEDGQFASVAGETCVPVALGLMETDGSPSGLVPSLARCEQAFVCGCCAVDVRWSSLDGGWRLSPRGGEDCTIDTGTYLLQEDAITRDPGGGSGTGGTSGSGGSGGSSSTGCTSNSQCGSRQRCRSGRCQSVQCTSDAHCSGCTRCSIDSCVACLVGPYGCTC